MQITSQNIAEEKWVIVGKKGVITLPKSMRDQIGMEEGAIAKAKLVDNKIVIEPREEFGYRIFTKAQIEQWKKDDELPPESAKETERYWDEQGLP